LHQWFDTGRRHGCRHEGRRGSADFIMFSVGARVPYGNKTSLGLLGIDTLERL
jgi:hypothetical protein